MGFDYNCLSFYFVIILNVLPPDMFIICDLERSHLATWAWLFKTNDVVS